MVKPSDGRRHSFKGCIESRHSALEVSVICTVLNEEDSIESLLDSLLSQTRPADEIVIIDGGSEDQTVHIVNSAVEAGAPVHLIAAPGANIAEGRNIAVRQARHDIIASIDGGCRADPRWLEELMRPFQQDSGMHVVGGFWLPEANSAFEECVGELICPRVETLDETQFLPSGRSIAFTKECWEAVGGYPEWLYTGEDSLFDLRLRDAGYRFFVSKDAVVYWKPRSTWRSLFKQYSLYAKGAAEAKIVTRTMSNAYGANPAAHVLHAARSLMVRKKIRAMCYLPGCLGVICVAKLAGLAAGKAR